MRAARDDGAQEVGGGQREGAVAEVLGAEGARDIDEVN